MSCSTTTPNSKVASSTGTADSSGDASRVVLSPLTGCRSDRNAATSQLLQDGVVVESKPLPDGGARQSLFVELGCYGGLSVGHPARCVNSLFGEDAGDSRSGDLEFFSNGSDVADSEVMSNEELGFGRS